MTSWVATKRKACNVFRSSRARLSVAGVLTLGALSLAAITSTTGAYFSDSKSGTVSGSIGSIKITGSGGSGANGLDLAFTNMLPGEPQTVTATFQNTGLNAQDVWVTFPNATALSALNNLGNYGNIQVNANSTDVFDSLNLSDHVLTCPPGSSDLAHMPHPQNPCKALPNKIKLFSNVAPGSTGQVSITFNYVSYMSTQSPLFTAFNTYPVSDQITVNAGDGTGSGLPYQLVATQVGQTP